MPTQGVSLSHGTHLSLHDYTRPKGVYSVILHGGAFVQRRLLVRYQELGSPRTVEDGPSVKRAECLWEKNWELS